MKRYANDKYYYWRDALTNPEASEHKNEKETHDENNRLDWLFPIIR